MRVELAHTLPGRVRLRLPHLAGQARILGILGQSLACLPGMRTVRVNRWTATVLITYDPERLSLAQLVTSLNRPDDLTGEVAATSEQIPAAALPVSASPLGLHSSEVVRRQRQYGPNTLPRPPVPPFWRRLLSQFTDLPSLILLTGTALSAITGRVWEVFAVGAATGLNALIGAWRAGHDDQALTALQALTPRSATVIRNGRAAVISATDLVPGDLVLLQVGDRVAADLVVIQAFDLEVDERHLLAADSLGPRMVEESHLLSTGSDVVRGRARAVVLATGSATTLGRIAHTLNQTHHLPTPVQRRTVRLARDLLKISLLAITVVVVAGLLRGLAPLELLRSGISLAAAAVPEGLPAYIALALAAGSRRLARRGAYVRELSTAEGIGAVDVICTDKTGTLTRGEMTVHTVFAGNNWWTVTGSGFEPSGKFLRDGEPVEPLSDPDLRAFVEAAARCNDAILHEGPDGELEVKGSQTEGALLVMALKAGLPKDFGRGPRLGEEPFDPARRRMTLTLGVAGAPLTCSKGAPESILPRCNRIMADGQERPMSDEDRDSIKSAVGSMAASGHRVLALAYAFGDRVREGLTFAGLAGIADPPRRELRSLFRRLEKAGIRTMMVTGDHPDTAAAVARDLGLLHEPLEVVTGDELKRLTDYQLARILSRAAVFARVTPEQKARVIRALQRKGHTIAYVGDGIDDAPAVRAADVGIVPRDRAIDVTREAASIILAEDRLETVVTAIEQGQNTAENTDEITRFLLTGNTAELLVLVASAAFGMPLALLPLQLIWLNLIGDGPAAIAMGERHAQPGGAIAARKRPVLSMEREILISGLLMGVAAFGLFASTLAGGGTLAVARTMAMGALTAGQILYLFRCRTDLNTPCGLRLPSEPAVTLAAATSALLLLATIYLPPLARALGTSPLSMSQWLGVAGAALAGNLPVGGFSLQRPALPHGSYV